ncbi:hypothetical protein [Listeria newyorkensis]|uniref:hypothetical protein n=1 Tax=Listeria newyorkensis TaxID=1497681 RepID=UPI00051DEE49|nr:hypothetical protein [Listeria newyorkensis]KGL43586.1 hypothetical protein EP58_07550 [Listeria newyorkensis]SQC56812.1 Uncharacterised protein [Listeria newyorkensis]
MEVINNLKELETKMENNSYVYTKPRLDQRNILLHLLHQGCIFVDVVDWKERRLFLISAAGNQICYLDKKRRGSK